MWASIDIDVKDLVDDLDFQDRKELIKYLTDGEDEDPVYAVAPVDVHEQIYRLKVLGLDTELSTVEILERLLR